MTDDIRLKIAALVSHATSGAVPAVAALSGDDPLFDLGLDSLGWLRLIDAIETRYGLDLQTAGTDLRQVTLARIVALLDSRA